MSTTGPAESVQHVRVVVVGSGFSGLGAAVRLRQEGVTDFLVLERAGSVGGTWRDNTHAPSGTQGLPGHAFEPLRLPEGGARRGGGSGAWFGRRFVCRRLKRRREVRGGFREVVFPRSPGAWT